jgi:gliding motility-associated-like protein
MKKHVKIKFLTFAAALFISSLSWGQGINCSISSTNNSICLGESSILEISPSYSGNVGCSILQSPILNSWTEIAPTADYYNLIKEGSTYYLRSVSDVFVSSNINGPWTSLNFNSQIGNTCSGLMLGFDWSNQLYVSTCHNDLYALSGTTWVPKGLGGFGCGGNFIQKLNNNRILVMKAGFLRDLYISDNNGNNWSNVTNVDNDYWDIIVADNGNIFSCGGSNTPSLTGIIKSTNNGQNWTQINSQLAASVTYVYALEKDCNGNLYAIGNDKIYKSQNNGDTWNYLNNVPAQGASYFEVATNGDLYIFINNNGFYKSIDNGATWQLISDFPIALNGIVRFLKQIDDKIVVFTTQGVFAKSISLQLNPVVWSDGTSNQSSIQVQPTQTTAYTVSVSNGSETCTDTIIIQVNNPPNINLGADTLTICGTSTTLDVTNPTAGNYLWNTGATSSTLAVTNSGSYSIVVTDTLGCSASDTVYVSILNPTITAGQSAFCLGDSTIISLSNVGGSCGTISSVLQTGLAAWYPFCSNADDLSSLTNNGTVNGAVLTDDYFSNPNAAYSFNGTNNTINLTNPFLNGGQANQFTMNARVNFNSLANSPNIWGKTKFWGEVNFGVDNNGKVFLIWANSISGNKYSSIVSQNGVITTNTWYDIAVVFQSGTGQIYINGQPIATSLTWTAQGGAILSTTSIENSCNFSQDANSSKFGVRIAGGSPVGYLNGVLDEFRIWDYALSPTLIQQNFEVSNFSSIWWSDGTTNQNSIQVQPTQTTTYSVTVSDGVGTCTDSITIQVNNPQVNAGSDLSVCEGETATLTATGADSYSWDNGVVNGQPFTPTVDGYYTVTGIDTLGCSNTVSVFLDILQPTSSAISPVSCDTYTAPDNEVYTSSGQYTAIIPNAAGCDSTITINLTVNNSNSGIDSKAACDSYTWIDGNTYTESTNSATFTLQNASGCDSVVTLNLTINKLQTLNAGADQTVCKGENVILTASGAETYSWNNGISDGMAFSPPLGTTTYTVTGTDGNGCTNTDELIVTSEYCFEIPGALSPNSDKNNDTWEITGLQNYPNAIISVFDRWGQKVYDGTSTSAPWNGKYQEKDLPTADYYYIIELGNGDTYNGVVTLKR